MAKSRAKFRGYAKIGKKDIRNKRVYCCKLCHLQHTPGHKPPECMQCGALQFYCFDSIGEAGRWHTLRVLEDRNMISDLRRQVPFKLMAARRIEGRLVEAVVGKYIADFVYERDGERVIEDFKGGITDLAAWKLRHMEAMGLPVKLTG